MGQTNKLTSQVSLETILTIAVGKVLGVISFSSY